MLSISKLRIPNINRLPINLIRPTRIIPENRNSLRDILTKNNIVRLAYKNHTKKCQQSSLTLHNNQTPKGKNLTIIPSINRRQNRLVPLTQIRQLPEQDSALLGREVPPFRASLESRAGGGDGGVDVFFSGGFDGRDDGLVVGVDGFDLLAGCGGDEFVVDEEAFLCGS
jgi:hypothetical protein